MSLMTTALVGMLLLADPNASPAEPAPRYVLLEFTASWCGPCQQMSPMIHRLQRQGYPIRQIDVDQHREFTSRCKVNSMPTFVLVADKKEVNRFVGACSEQKLLALFAEMEEKYPTGDDEPLFVDNETPAKEQTLAETAPAKKRKSIFNLPFSKQAEEREPFDMANATIRANNALPGSDDDATPLKETTAVAPANNPLAASVRLRVKDTEGLNLGSGTIIHSIEGRTIIITCGHIFRHVDENSRIEVDLFVNQQVESYIGTVISYDLEADVGVLSIETDTPVNYAFLQSLEKKVQVGNDVFSIGCGGGDDPTVQKLSVTALNRYLGPDNIECTGVPVQGRSGGGLFNNKGEVIGVCFAADSNEGRGLYAGLKPIYELLAEAKLIESVDGIEHTIENRTVAENDLEADAFGEKSTTETPFDELRSEPGHDFDDASTPAVVGSNANEAALAEAAGLDSLEGAEVVCIIRPVKESRAASRVVIIHRASPKFINYLTEEVSLQPTPTSVHIPHTAAEQQESGRPKFIIPAPAIAHHPAAKYQRYQRSER